MTTTTASPENITEDHEQKQQRVEAEQHNKKKKSSAQDDYFSNRRMTPSQFKRQQLQDGEGKEQQEKEEVEGEEEGEKLCYPRYQGEGYPFRSFTKDERKNYAMVTSKSGGFECPSIPPGVTFPGIVVPLNLENIPVESLNGLHDFAKLALKDYNERNNTSHQFVNLIKVNTGWNGCTTRYITFQAGSPALNFEAKVVTFMCNSKVKFCRVAQDSNSVEAFKAMPWLEKWIIAMGGEGQMRPHGQGNLMDSSSAGGQLTGGKTRIPSSSASAYVT